VNHSRVFIAAAFVALSAGCSDQSLLTAPDQPSLSQHPAGVAEFAFLAPLGAVQPPAGTFDPAASPRIEICGYTGAFHESACAQPVAVFRIDVKGKPRRLAVKPGAYEAEWSTKPNLDQTRTYRIRVLLGTRIAGEIDAGFDESLAGTGYYALTRKESLLIRFWIGTASRVSPAVTITAPADQATYNVGALVNFTGSAQDQDGNQLTGTALVWTSSQDGELGTGTTSSSSDLSAGEHVITLAATDAFGSHASASITITVAPVLVPSTIASGEGHTCALTSSGAAYCWGWNGYGQLGTDSYTSSLTPLAVKGGLTFTSLTAGSGHTCGRASSGQSYCWGDNDYGQLGIASFSGSKVPAVVNTNVQFSQLSAGWEYTCGLTAGGNAYCWGRNVQGRLGVGDLDHRMSPAAVVGGLTFKSIGTGNGYQTCAVTSASRGYCWGDNGFYQLGLGLPHTVSYSTSPLAVETAVDFTAIQVGEWFSCGLSTGGLAYCWGQNYGGRLGNSLINIPQSAPYAVIGGFTYTSISLGRVHACARTSAGEVYCWGENAVGQLGDNSTNSRGAPRVVSGDHNFSRVSAGGRHNCAVTPVGAIYCWGQNGVGGLGDGTTIDRWIPTAAMPLPSP
jgi:alpha-tubulin suppressor-like RCC1 family protein